jgi:fluoride exporter
MTKLISLLIGGMVGTAARYLITGLVGSGFGGDITYGTLTVNLIGCFLIGFLAAFKMNHELKLLLIFGFCGAFTTFSTFMLETANLIKYGEVLKAFSYVSLSVVAGFFVFWMGAALAR